MNISTEGVLVLASAQGLLNEYKDKEFDYGFPEGLSNLLEKQTIIALQTSDGDELLIDFVENIDSEEFDKEINQIIDLQTNDTLLVLSHAEFTQICSNNGKINDYLSNILKIENIEAGKYHVKIRIKNVSEEFDEYEAYFKLSISMNKVENSNVKNEVFEIG